MNLHLSTWLFILFVAYLISISAKVWTLIGKVIVMKRKVCGNYVFSSFGYRSVSLFFFPNPYLVINYFKGLL